MNNYKLNLILILILFSFSSVYSQYTDVINSNKPGFSESPYSVGSGVYQFENNFFLRNVPSKNDFSIPQSFGFDMLFRTSFFLEKLELNAQVAYQKDKVVYKNLTNPNYYTSGYSNFTIGAKYLVFQQEYEDKTKEVRSWKRRLAFDKKRLIPSVAVYVGVNTDFLNGIYQTGQISPKAGILLQNNLSNDFNVITNFYYDKIGTDFDEFSYIITGTYNFNGRFSSFIENQTLFKKTQNETNLGAGFAYLFNPNLQINTSGRLLFEEQGNGFYVGLGVSYRINKHKDSYTDLEKSKNDLIDTPISKYNKQQNNWFRRFLNLFNKNDTSGKQRQRIKGTKKRGSSKKRKTKKKETEVEKLEREIKELEKQLKKDEKKNRKNDN
ncbi:transporter [uncultured Polaribacter sp.]|uniref:transporter n=1 Tax=uncultured Polaribacter sp. TaxID=174711 RepID=UPI002625D630|nr:transporter [uncultured Polaribacter sp.]